jgi:hypothetical protein
MRFQLLDRVLGDAKTEAMRAGAEITMGLGQYQVSDGKHTTIWLDSERAAWVTFCAIADIPYSPTGAAWRR